MKRFEKYISENIGSFNNEEPSINIKNAILTSINKDKKKTREVKMKWLIAAAILVIVFSNIISFSYGYWYKTKIETSISQAVPDFKNADKYYSKQILVLRETIQKTNIESSIDFSCFDNMISELKEELSYAPAFRKKRIAKRIINGYKTEIKLLKKMTLRINNIS